MTAFQNKRIQKATVVHHAEQILCGNRQTSFTSRSANFTVSSSRIPQLLEGCLLQMSTPNPIMKEEDTDAGVADRFMMEERLT